MDANPVARLRRARHMTQAGLAQACMVSARTIKRAERGEPLSAETVLALCSVLGCVPADLSASAHVRSSDPIPASGVRDGHASDVARAIGWGAVLAMSLDLVAFRVCQSIPGSAGEGWPRYVTVALVGLAAIAALGVQAVILAWKSHALRGLLPSWMRLGPLPVALLAAFVTPFPAMGIGLAMADGHGVQSIPAMLAAVIMPALGIVAAVLGADPDRVPTAAIMRACSPHLAALTILVQVVGAASGDAAAAAAGTLLLFPAMMFAPGLSRNAALACAALTCLPALQQVYVEGLLPPAPVIHAMVTYCFAAGVDVVAFLVLARTRPRLPAVAA